MLFGRRSTQIAAPFVVADTGRFDGIDGNWSTFKLQVGSPPQEFRVQVSTVGQTSWLPGYVPDNYCPWLNASYPDPNNCQSLRGVDSTDAGTNTGYNSSLSSSFQETGTYNLSLSSDLDFPQYYGSNYSAPVVYGTDDFTLSSNAGGELTQAATPFSSVPDNVELFMGSIGLGFGKIDLGQGATKSSLMEMLSNTSDIPSRSWGYTAGAAYNGEQLSPLLHLEQCGPLFGTCL